MMPARRHFFLVTTGCLLTGFVAGCGTTGPCGPEVRDVTASTSQNTSLGADYALISVGQSRGAPDHVSWVAQNTTVAPGDTVPYRLEQHVVAARPRDGAADGVVLLELPLQGLEGFDGVGGTWRSSPDRCPTESSKLSGRDTRCWRWTPTFRARNTCRGRSAMCSSRTGTD
jgi:hypothetical protein